jgi:predicted N-acyltransferase
VIDIKMATSIVDFIPEEWDRVVDDQNFYQSHAWLRGLEYLWGSRGIIAGRVGSELVGALPIWAGEHDTPGLFHLSSMFGDVPGQWKARFLWLGSHRGVSNGLIVAPGNIAVLGELLDYAWSTAARAGLAGVVMPYVPIGKAVALAAHHPAAHVLLHSAEAEMVVPPDGFAGHLATLCRRDRIKQRAELRQFHSTGNSVTWTPLTGAVVAQAADLITQNRARYGSGQGREWMNRSFAAQERSGVLGQATAGLCRREGRTIAIMVCYRFRSRLYARYFGFDYATTKPRHEYFVLSYSMALDYAARQGFRRYHLATSALDVKIRRGADLIPQAAVVLPVTDWWLAPEAVRGHNHRFAARFHIRFGHRLGCLDWRRWHIDVPDGGNP